MQDEDVYGSVSGHIKSDMMNVIRVSGHTQVTSIPV